jgi:hypothetical protein
MRVHSTFVAAMIMSAGIAVAQNPPTSAVQGAPADRMATELRQAYTRMSKYLLDMAEKMPAEEYGFKPTPGMRTFAANFGHNLDMRFNGCTAVNGSPAKTGNMSLTTKDELVAAMKAATLECDKAFVSLTADTAGQVFTAGRGGQQTKIGLLNGVVVHDNEQYGYLAVYLRLKGITPPSDGGGL